MDNTTAAHAVAFYIAIAQSFGTDDWVMSAEAVCAGYLAASGCENQPWYRSTFDKLASMQAQLEKIGLNFAEFRDASSVVIQDAVSKFVWREISPEELADLPEKGWENSLIDTSRYYESVPLAFEVDERTYKLVRSCGWLCISHAGKFFVA